MKKATFCINGNEEKNEFQFYHNYQIANFKATDKNCWERGSKHMTLNVFCSNLHWLLVVQQHV